MKKITFLFSFIALTIVGLGIYSCQKNTVEDTSFANKLNILERKVSSESISIDRKTINNDLDN